MCQLTGPLLRQDLGMYSPKQGEIVLRNCARSNFEQRLSNGFLGEVGHRQGKQVKAAAIYRLNSLQVL